MNLTLQTNPNGSFALYAGTACLVSDAYPAIDGRPIRPLRVEASADQVCYTLSEGRLILALTAGDATGTLTVRLRDWTRPVYRLSVFNGVLGEIDGAYQSSGEIGEECGYVSRQKLAEKTQLVSRGLTALSFAAGTAAFYVTDHTRWHQEFRWEQLSDGRQTLSADFRLEEVNGREECLPPVTVALCATLEEALATAASAIGREMGARQKMPPAYHWCSWYYNYSEFNEDQLTEYLEGFGQVPETKKLQYFQIDAGNCEALGDWLVPRSYWSRGLDTAIRQVQEAGFAPGIWIGPFMVGNRSRLAAEHPDWILCDREGKRLIGFCTDNEPRLWGYHDEEYYILDTSHPDAMAYLRGVFTAMKGWGVKLFKTDFMLWGYQDSTKVRRHTPGKTSVEYFREVLRMIRETIGEETYWLGCIAPFFPFIGYADGMRIGGDVGSSWDGQFNPHNMMMTVQGNYYTNFRYYQNDPDSIFFRDFHIRLKDHEIEALALYAALSGGCVYTSDPIHKLRPDRLALWKFLCPDGGRHIPGFPYQQEDREEVVLTHRGKDGGGLLFVFNPTERPVLQTYDLEKMGFAPAVWAVEKGTSPRRESGELLLCTQPHSHRLLVLGPDETVSFDTENLWNNLQEA